MILLRFVSSVPHRGDGGSGDGSSGWRWLPWQRWLVIGGLVVGLVIGFGIGFAIARGLR